MEHRALWALMLALGCVVVTYPLAWLRMQRIALESEGETRRLRAGSVDACVVRIARGAGHVALHRQTMARNSRYQVYRAMYCGVGLALAIACGSTLADNGRPAVSLRGLHAVAPLLIFWIVAGLRMAFALERDRTAAAGLFRAAFQFC